MDIAGMAGMIALCCCWLLLIKVFVTPARTPFNWSVAGTTRIICFHGKRIM